MRPYKFVFQNNVNKDVITKSRKGMYDFPELIMDDSVATYSLHLHGGNIRIKSLSKTGKLCELLTFNYDTRQTLYSETSLYNGDKYGRDWNNSVDIKIKDKFGYKYWFIIELHEESKYCSIYLVGSMNETNSKITQLTQSIEGLPLKLGHCLLAYIITNSHTRNVRESISEDTRNVFEECDIHLNVMDEIIKDIKKYYNIFYNRSIIKYLDLHKDNMSGVFAELRQRQLKKKLLEDILRVTHCQGCGSTKPVCLVGYVGRYCSKGCWNILDDDDEDDCDDEDAKGYSMAHSRYHREYYKYVSRSGYYWPMCNIKIPCYNECIRTKEPIHIPNY